LALIEKGARKMSWIDILLIGGGLVLVLLLLAKKAR